MDLLIIYNPSQNWAKKNKRSDSEQSSQYTDISIAQFSSRDYLFH